MGHRDPSSDPSRAQFLPPFYQPQQSLLRALIDPKEPYHLGQNLMLGSAAKLEGNGIGVKEIAKTHDGGSLEFCLRNRKGNRGKGLGTGLASPGLRK